MKNELRKHEEIHEVMDSKHKTVVESDMASEAWQDIGYTEKSGPKKKESHPYAHFKPGEVFQHEGEDKTLDKIERARKALSRICRQVPESSCFVLDFQGKKVQFWLASNTYYSHAAGRYGYDIERLCKKIQKELKIHF